MGGWTLYLQHQQLLPACLPTASGMVWCAFSIIRMCTFFFLPFYFFPPVGHDARGAHVGICYDMAGHDLVHMTPITYHKNMHICHTIYIYIYIFCPFLPFFWCTKVHISEVPDDEVFKICLEFYHHFSQDLYQASRRKHHDTCTFLYSV